MWSDGGRDVTERALLGRELFLESGLPVDREDNGRDNDDTGRYGPWTMLLCESEDDNSSS